jgi:hypothetical protein
MDIDFTNIYMYNDYTDIAKTIINFMKSKGCFWGEHLGNLKVEINPLRKVPMYSPHTNTITIAMQQSNLSDWWQFSYQFSHELLHSYTSQGYLYSLKLQWFDELLAHSIPYYTLDFLSGEFKNFKGIILDYKNINLKLDREKIYSLKEFKEFIKKNIADLESTKIRIPASPIVTFLYDNRERFDFFDLTKAFKKTLEKIYIKQYEVTEINHDNGIMQIEADLKYKDLIEFDIYSIINDIILNCNDLHTKSFIMDIFTD